MRRSHSSSEARAGWRGGRASHASTHGIMAATAEAGPSTLGKVLGEMKISAAKKQVLQSIAGSFPCNAVLHKWNIVPLAACTLCGHPAETQSHIQCLWPALKRGPDPGPSTPVSNTS
jgi:hypothetical protein